MGMKPWTPDYQPDQQLNQSNQPPRNRFTNDGGWWVILIIVVLLAMWIEAH